MNERRHRSTAHSRGDRPRQHSSRPGRPGRPGRCTRRRQWYVVPQNPRRPHRARLVPRRDGLVEDRAAMGCLCEVRRLCPRMFDGINANAPYRWKRSTPTAPPDVTRLSDHITRVSDVLCLSAVTIRSLVHDWLEAEGHDVCPGEWWVKQLLRACA